MVQPPLPFLALPFLAVHIPVAFAAVNMLVSVHPPELCELLGSCILLYLFSKAFDLLFF
jgi:hypothetical protein